jgi:hypothetical protein
MAALSIASLKTKHAAGPVAFRLAAIGSEVHVIASRQSYDQPDAAVP